MALKSVPRDQIYLQEKEGAGKSKENEHETRTSNLLQVHSENVVVEIGTEQTKWSSHQ